MFKVEDKFDYAIFDNYIDAQIYAERRSEKEQISCDFMEIDENGKEVCLYGTCTNGKWDD